jgi:hypothetical protein
MDCVTAEGVRLYARCKFWRLVLSRVCVAWPVGPRAEPRRWVGGCGVDRHVRVSAEKVDQNPLGSMRCPSLFFIRPFQNGA